jgi:hypothetical protein
LNPVTVLGTSVSGSGSSDVILWWN